VKYYLVVLSPLIAFIAVRVAINVVRAIRQIVRGE
jgi:hypothetical protein